MYIVAIGWLYVALMMAITEHSIVAGVATFLLYGLGPVSIVLYILGTPGRRQRRREQEEKEEKEEKEAREERERGEGARQAAPGMEGAEDTSGEPRAGDATRKP